MLGGAAGAAGVRFEGEAAELEAKHQTWSLQETCQEQGTGGQVQVQRSKEEDWQAVQAGLINSRVPNQSEASGTSVELPDLCRTHQMIGWYLLLCLITPSA